MKRPLALYFAGALAISALTSCEESPARPTIVESKMEIYFWASSKINVRVRNDGRDGWIAISYNTTRIDTDYDITRRGGIERSIREAVNGDDSKYVLESKKTTVQTGNWECRVFLKAGETKLVQLELPGRSGADAQHGPFVTSVHSKTD